LERRALGTAAVVIPFLRRPSLLTIVWIVVGVAIAASKHYFDNLNTAKQILSAVLAVLLWPLLLLGIDLHVK
jgi:ABC-type anion transport system duplicated permease subunit